jgi:hypothetical protein
MADKDEPRTIRNSTPDPKLDKLEGQCQVEGCLSSREPNGSKYTCPRCLKEGK